MEQTVELKVEHDTEAEAPHLAHPSMLTFKLMAEPSTVEQMAIAICIQLTKNNRPVIVQYEGKLP